MSMTENKEWTPTIVAFCCNWCSYAGADLAGSSRTELSGERQDHSHSVLLPFESPCLCCARFSAARTA